MAFGGIPWEKEGIAEYGGMVQPSQQYLTPCEKRIELGLGTRGLRIVAVFCAGILIEVTQEDGMKKDHVKKRLSGDLAYRLERF